MKEINRRCDRLPKRKYRVQWVQPEISMNATASLEHYKAFHDSVMSDPTIAQHVKNRHKKVAMSAAISAGIRNGLNKDQINGEEL